jgi:hypothetical protein
MEQYLLKRDAKTEIKMTMVSKIVSLMWRDAGKPCMKFVTV